MLNVTQTSVKQATLLDGVDVGLPKWCTCGRGINYSVHKGMKAISNVEVHWICEYYKPVNKHIYNGQ